MSQKGEGDRITVRMDSVTSKQLEDIAKTIGQNRAATVRQLIKEASEKQNKNR